MAKLYLSSKDIFDKKFVGNKIGYDCLQVDQFLDIVIKDYQYVETNLLKIEQDYNSLKASYDDLIKDNNILKKENDSLMKKIETIENSSYSGQDNLTLLNRINRLEFALHKAGINPKDVD